MRLMTYNILTGGRDEGDDQRLADVCEVVRRAQPDILVLNECNDFERQGHRTLYRVERELGMRGFLATAATGFHVALFLRAGQLTETSNLGSVMHHAAVVAKLSAGGSALTIVGAHLCPFGGDNRLGEVQHLVRHLREGELLFVMGDLNSVSPHDVPHCAPAEWLARRRSRHCRAGSREELDTRAIATLEAADLVDLYRHANDGAYRPTALTRLKAGWERYQVRIDYILGSREAADRVRRCAVIDDELTNRASDHYPLFVDADL